MSDDLILANATLVLPGETRPGSVRLKDGEIAEIGEGSAVPPGAVDMAGDLLSPGLVELHTDNLERHMSPRPGVKWPHQSAIVAHDAELAGVGITTVFDAIRVGSIVSEKRSRYGRYARDMANAILQMRARGALRISHFLHLRAEICSETLIEELAEFSPDDRVGILSLMDHTPGQRQFSDLEKFREYVCGKVGLSHAEFEDHVAHLYAIKSDLGPAHEAAAVDAGRRLGAVLASHDDTTEVQVATSASQGVGLAEFPTTEEAAMACQRNRIAVMMGAPNLIRGGSHSGNVAASTLAENGTLDILSSDYVPGALLLGGIKLGEILGDTAAGLHTVTAAPAAAAGLKDRGRIETGFRADLIRIAIVDNVPVVRGVWVRGERAA